MKNPRTPQGPIPSWAWAFVAACVAIPVVALGGAIPGALGGGGAFACVAIARQVEKTMAFRALLCTGVTAACWALFGVMILVFVSASQPASSSDPAHADRSTSISRSTNLSSESKRREIYALAMSMLPKIEKANSRRIKLLAEGRSTQMVDKQIAHLEKMHTDRFGFTVRFHRITEEQLDEIIEEGDAAAWPME